MTPRSSSLIADISKYSMYCNVKGGVVVGGGGEVALSHIAVNMGYSQQWLPPPLNLTELGLVGTLNNNVLYDSTELINSFFNNNTDDNFSLFDDQICSLYVDINSLIDKYSNTGTPLILSLNIRSLSSNHSNLVNLLHQLEVNKIDIHTIVLQETWNVKFPELLTRPSFKKLHLK